MLWLYGLLSANFSVPRCSRPMCGSALVMISPSISSTRRSTPWAAGCCGPKFMVKFWISGILGSLLECLVVARVVADHPRHQHARLDAHRLVHHPLLLLVVAHFHVAGEREILAERMAHEAVVREDAAQVGVAVEQHAEEVEGLALEPGGGGPDVDDRVHHRRFGAGAEDPEAQPLVAAHGEQVVDHGVAPFRRRGGLRLGALHAAAEAGLGGGLGAPLRLAVAQVVHAADVHELLEAEGLLVPQRLGDFQQLVGAHLVGELVRGGRHAHERVLEARFHLLGQFVHGGGHRSVSPYYRAMVLVRRIFFCNWMMPYRSCSALGGQPGTYTSTGTMRSQPRTTA